MPKKHYSSTLECDEEIFKDYKDLQQKICKVLEGNQIIFVETKLNDE